MLSSANTIALPVQLWYVVHVRVRESRTVSIHAHNHRVCTLVLRHVHDTRQHLIQMREFHTQRVHEPSHRVHLLLR